MKTKHLTVRLDDDTAAIVEKYQTQFGTKTSETISRLIRAADGEKFVTVVSSAVAHTEELSFFAGQLEKMKMLWREIKSRLNAPRPMNPSDTAAIKQWQEERQQIKKFYDDSDALWKQSHALAAKLTGISPENIQQMERTITLLEAWVVEYRQIAEKAEHPEDRKTHLRAIDDFKMVISTIKRIGI